MLSIMAISAEDQRANYPRTPEVQEEGFGTLLPNTVEFRHYGANTPGLDFCASGQRQNQILVLMINFDVHRVIRNRFRCRRSAL